MLLSNNGAATDDFNVTGSLGGNLKGIIEFNTTAGQLIANAVIGTNHGAGRAAQFITTGDVATINGQVYAKNVTINDGATLFNHIVDVGTDGTTSFVYGKVLSILITQNSNLGATDFANTGSLIEVADTNNSYR